MAWRRQSCALPDVSIGSGGSLASSCGVSCDREASWVVVWQGDRLAWFNFRPGLHDPVVGSWQFSFEGRGDVLSAQPVPLANTVIVVLSTQKVSAVHWQPAGTTEFVLSSQQAIAAWPVGGSDFVVVSSTGHLEYFDLERSLTPLRLGQDMSLTFEEVHVTTSHQLGSSGDALLAIGGRSNGRRMLCIWRLRGSTLLGLSELSIPADQSTGSTDSSATNAEPADDGPSIVDLAISSMFLCVLLADGSIVLASCSTDSASWSVQMQISAWRIAGLRLCSVAGVDQAVMEETEPPGVAPTTTANCLHLWESELSLLFWGGPDHPASVAEVVSLKVPALGPVDVEPHRVLCACPVTAEGKSAGPRVLARGSAGSKFVCITVQGHDNNGTVVEILERIKGRGQTGGPIHIASNATVQQFHALLNIVDLEQFVQGTLDFNPFADSKQLDKETIFFGCEQVQRLLEMAQSRLHHVLGEALPSASQGAAEAGGDGWDDGGWDVDDFDFEEDGGGTKAAVEAAGAQVSLLSEEDTPRFQALLARVRLQLGRLKIFRCVKNEMSAGSAQSLSWSSFREMEGAALRRLSCQMAADQCIPFLEALFEQHWESMMPQWNLILDSMPETIPVQLVRRILPALPGIKGITWYIQRSQQIVQLTGMCHLALELLWHGIHVLITGQWPQEHSGSDDQGSAASRTAANLPSVSEVTTGTLFEVEALCGTFRLCMEYAAYSKVALRELYRRQPSLFDRHRGGSQDGLLAEIMTFMDFCALEARQRAQLVLRHSTAETIVQDASEWALQVSVEHCLASSGTSSLKPRTEAEIALLRSSSPVAGLISRAIAACTEPVEEALVEGLIECLGGCGWEPTSLHMMAQVVQASRPDLPPKERIIRSNLRLLEFILGTVYSDDQRCRALDIFESVDMMYGCIPNKDAQVPKDGAARWEELQQQADELEKHLNCVVLLQEYKIGLSISFADLRRGCSNEPMAVRSLWNLFRVLGARFRPALFWKQFKDKFMYLHENAFGAVDRSSVYAMFVRCIVEQEHFQILSEVTEDWANSCGASAVAGSLAFLAQELVNSSPALRHPSLEKATRVLKCIPQVEGELQGVAQAELDFIKACELLHDLVHLQPKSMLHNLHNLKNINPIASLSQVTTKVSAQIASKRPLEKDSLNRETSVASVQSSHSAVGFRIDGPMQLRLQLDQPLRVVTDLLQYNPSVLAEVEELHTFCKLLGLAPTSPAWAEVMAMCGAGNLVSGNRGEALNVTEKLLANGHPAAWKLALALASSEEDMGSACGKLLEFDQCSDLLADATKICPPEELHHLLSSFNQGCPLLAAESLYEGLPETPNTCIPRGHSKRMRGYTYDDGQKTSLSIWARGELGLDPVNPFGGGDKVSASKLPGIWRGLHLWQGAEEKWSNVNECQSWGEALLALDRDAGTVLLDATPVGLPGVQPEAPQRIADRSLQLTMPTEKPIAHPPSSSAPAAKSVAAPVSTAPTFPINFEEDATNAVSQKTAGRTAQAEWPPDSQQESQPPRPAKEPYAEHERAVYQNMLPSLQTSEATWTSAARALQDATSDATEDSSAKVLLWRRVLDMCEEVMRAQGHNECPESATEPVAGVVTSVLSSMHQACPELDLVCQGSTLAEEVLRCASAGTDVAQKLMRAIAGVGALQEAGVCPSSVALEAAKRTARDHAGERNHNNGGNGSSCTSGLAALVPWLNPRDVLELLAAVMNDTSIPRVRQMEVLGHVRSSCSARTEMLPGDQQRLQHAIRQAEVLALLRSVFEAHYGNLSGVVEFPLRLDASAPLSSVRAEWARTLQSSSDAAVIFPCVEPILQGLESDA